MAASETVHLLWTGGWDSTFRLLDLLLLKQRTVQPHYLIDCGRSSFAREIQTIRSLKNLLLEKVPSVRPCLLPTIFTEIGDIRPNPVITEQFGRLRARSYLGDQYEWLARYAEEAGLSDLELSIHKDDKAHDFLEHSVARASARSDSSYRLRSDPPDPDLQLFRYFSFPLFEMQKLEMQQVSVKHGFDDLMEHTWFCHEPLWNGKPCGTCAPCRYTREEGLGRRIPRIGQMRYFLAYGIIRSASVRRAVSAVVRLRRRTR